MELIDYQNQIQNYPQYRKGLGPYSTTMGINVTLGKISGVLFNLLNDNKDDFDEKSKKLIKMYMGDLLYWIAATATDMGDSLEDVAQLNLNKLDIIKQENLKKEEEEQLQYTIKL